MDLPHGPAPHPPSRTGRSGFSLAEVLVVIVIIGIGTAMAVPRVNLTHHRTETAVHEVATLLMAAQRAAVAGQHDVVVAFETGPRAVRVHHDLDNDGAMEDGEPLRRTRLPDLVVFGRTVDPLPQLGSAAVSFQGRQAGAPAVTFNRGGSASEEGGVYLTTTPESGPRPSTARAVVVDRPTARAATFRYRSSGWERRF